VKSIILTDKCCQKNKLAKLVMMVMFVVLILGVDESLTLASNPVINRVAQQQTVSGVVVDAASGETLPGVGVKVDGTNYGVLTDLDGKFLIKVAGNETVLVFSYIGYESKNVTVGSNAVIRVELNTSATKLDEVVVVGYGFSKRKDLTGSVGTANVEDLQKASVKSLDEALSGRIAGVMVTSADGQPGSNADIVIRGIGSVTQSTAPLYVIDGFPQEAANFNSINPQDIESIDVLKDASSTAIYGARGSNGVILVTTKRGKSAKPTIVYNGYVGTQQLVKKMSLLDTYEFVRFQNDATPGYATSTYLTSGKTLEDYKTAQTIDWQDKVFKDNPLTYNHSLSVSGRMNKTAFMISGSYTNQQGLVINSGFKRYQGRVTLDQEINDKVKVGVNVNYSNATSFGISGAVSNGNSSYFSFLTNLWTYRPVLGATVSDEDYENFITSTAYDPNDNSYRLNPYISTANYDGQSNVVVFTPNAYLEYKITKNLTFKSTIGTTVNDTKSYVFNGSNTYEGNPYYGFGKTYGVNASRTNSTNYSLLNENILTYSRKFNGVHTLTSLVGFTTQKNTSESNFFRTTNIPTEVLGINGIGLGTPYASSASASLNTMMSYLGRVNYSYKDRYLFTFSLRADGSSKFSAENKWGYFPSGAFSWRLSEEKFVKSLNIQKIENIKFRVSYGATGNNRVDDFAYLTLLSMSGSSSGSGSMVAINKTNSYVSTISSTMGNNKLKWETGIQTDIGLDFSLFKGRLDVQTDYYYKTTKDLLIKATLPTLTGYSTGFKNIGKVSNAGFEFTLNSVNINNGKFIWQSSFNISFNRNRLKSLNSGENELLSSASFRGTTMQTNSLISKVDHPINMFYGYVADGNYQLSDFYKLPNGATGYTFVLKEGIPYYGNQQSVSSVNTNAPQNCVQPGDPKFKDLNGDGVIDAKDGTTIGCPYPVHFGGLTNNFSYKGFGLSVFLQWSYGNDILNENRIMMEQGSLGSSSTSTTGVVGQINNNQFATVANRWTYTNASNLYTRIDALAQGTRVFSTRFIEDGSYLRVKTVQLSYTLPLKLVNKVGITGVKVYVAGQNLFTITGYSGTDPELSTSGVDYSPYPRQKVFTFGTTITL
jgi:TonB-dependent starch-binding outer membrane protein SusC